LAVAAAGSAVNGDFLPLFHGFHEKTLSHSKHRAAGLQNEGAETIAFAAESANNLAPE
jgi:hypothetical protein